MQACFIQKGVGWSYNSYVSARKCLKGLQINRTIFYSQQTVIK